MITKHRVQLDGIQMDSIHPSITINAINESAVKLTPQTGNLYMGGTRLARILHDSVEVTVQYQVGIKRDRMPEHAAIVGQVEAFAAGVHYLTVSHRPNQRMRVMCVGATTLGDPFNWGDTYSLTFRSIEGPYWEDAQMWSEYGRYTLRVTNSGHMDTVADFIMTRVANVVGRITQFEINNGSQHMKFTGIEINNDYSLAVTHRDDGLQTIIGTETGESLMNKRTIDSDDEIILKPGLNVLTFDANVSGYRVEVRWRGRYY